MLQELLVGIFLLSLAVAQNTDVDIQVQSCETEGWVSREEHDEAIKELEAVKKELLRRVLANPDMQGPPGPPGPQGDTGPAGSPGSTGPPGPTTGGIAYVRWGRTTCPSTPGTRLVYKGRAGGSHFSHSGGGADRLCLPENPQYLGFQSGFQGTGYLHGAEYERWGNLNGRGLFGNQPIHPVYEQNVPCAVCSVSTREMLLMIPARTSCPSSWTREYYGYLMAERWDYARSSYDCVDKNPEAVPGNAANQDGALFHHVEATCNGLPCSSSQYVEGREITCTVCTK